MSLIKYNLYSKHSFKLQSRQAENGNVEEVMVHSLVKSFALLNPNGLGSISMHYYPQIIRNALQDPSNKNVRSVFKSIVDPKNSGKITMFGYIRYILETTNIAKTTMKP